MVHVFTDGSVERRLKNSATAFVIPALNVSWPVVSTSWRHTQSAECDANEAALKKIKLVGVRRAVVLTLSTATQF